VKDEVASQGVPAKAIKVIARAHIRYAGTDTALVVTAGSLAAMTRAFEKAHKAQFGFIDRDKELVLEAVSVEAIGGGAKFRERKLKTTRGKLPSPARRTRFFSQGAWHRAAVYTREQLKPGQKVKGPAIIIEPHQTIVVEPGWQAALTAKNHLVLTRFKKLKRVAAVGTRADPVMLEVFNNLFMSIAEQMGVALQNTAYSVNIKERLDFSCAVFSGDGALVANAPHMPVHLGSMDRAVETIIRENKGRIRPGDVYAINAPYNGGTHLPDITVCTPVFDGAERKILFWVASRGHHADVGGISPGSMSPNATNIEEEGVYLDNFKLVDRGRFREREIYAALTGAKYPARNPVQNVNDLKAQIAANEKGVQELRKMVTQFSLPVVQAYMKHVQDNAAESVRRVIDKPAQFRNFPTRWIRAPSSSVRITVDKTKREATVDFTGTSPQQAEQLQCARAGDARRGALCVSRDGGRRHSDECRLLAPDQHRHSETDTMLTPEYPAAVVAGNVEGLAGGDQLPVRRARRACRRAGHDEQSQFRQHALSVLRNDLLGLTGRSRFQRHRCRAYPHDQYSRLTDPEILEFRYPVVLEDFHIRKGSGGQGQMARGRRHPPHHPLSGADGMHAAHRPSPCAPVRTGGRRGRSDRGERSAAQGRQRSKKLQGLRRHHDRRG
jgi:5-oxoprolinase (ATP-hydrolysing)